MKQCSLGHVNSDSTDFCTTCGQQLLAAQAPQVPQASPTPPVMPPGMGSMQPGMPPVMPQMQAPVNPSANPWASPPPPVGGWQPQPYQQFAPSPSSTRGWIIGGIAIGVLVLLVGVFALTRGGDDTTARSSSGNSNSDTSYDPPGSGSNGGSGSYQSDGEQIRLLLESQNVYVSASDASLEELADTVCQAVGTGTSTGELMMVAMDSGFTQDEAASIVAASIIVKCPWES